MHKSSLLALLIFFVTPQIANACTIWPRSSHTFDKDEWNRIIEYKEDYASLPGKPKITKYGIVDIIMFYPECTSRRGIETCEWLDLQSCTKKITAKFRDGELIRIRKSGF